MISKSVKSKGFNIKPSTFVPFNFFSTSVAGITVKKWMGAINKDFYYIKKWK